MPLKKLPTLIQDAQKGRAPDDERPVVFLVQDEARFGRITQPVRCWAPLGIRPSAPNQIIRQSIYAFAAIAPKTGQMTSLILPTVNSDMMSLFLEQVSKDFISSFVIMQVDGASWHHSQKVRIPENIRLIFQPPYSPQVNPTEHIWEEIREKHFGNRPFPTLDALQDHLCMALDELSCKPDSVRSITYFPHIRVACENAN